MTKLLYRLFDYRFVYLGWIAYHPWKSKIGIAKGVSIRWKSIGRSLKKLSRFRIRTICFPYFFLPTFQAEKVEAHCHRVMKVWNRPVVGMDGGTEMFTFINPLSWLPWLYVVFFITICSILTHLIIFTPLLGVYVWLFDEDIFSIIRALVLGLQHLILWISGH